MTQHKACFGVLVKCCTPIQHLCCRDSHWKAPGEFGTEDLNLQSRWQDKIQALAYGPGRMADCHRWIKYLDAGHRHFSATRLVRHSREKIQDSPDCQGQPGPKAWKTENAPLTCDETCPDRLSRSVSRDVNSEAERDSFSSHFTRREWQVQQPVGESFLAFFRAAITGW